MQKARRLQKKEAGFRRLYACIVIAVLVTLFFISSAYSARDVDWSKNDMACYVTVKETFTKFGWTGIWKKIWVDYFVISDPVTKVRFECIAGWDGYAPLETNEYSCRKIEESIGKYQINYTFGSIKLTPALTTQWGACDLIYRTFISGVIKDRSLFDD